MRSREEFIRLHEHEFKGYVLDAVTSRRSGGDLALWLEQISRKIEARLGKAYDDLLKPEVNDGRIPATDSTRGTSANSNRGADPRGAGPGTENGSRTQGPVRHDPPPGRPG